jgi:hypothetical protein
MAKPIKKKQEPYLWLDRWVARPVPFVTLVRSEEAFLHAMEHCKIAPVNAGPWVSGDGSACCHYLDNVDGGSAVIVAISVTNETPIQIACLLVHEAVHIIQHYFEEMNEKHPASEQEAYAIQSMSQTLMEEYLRQIDQEFPE